MKTDRGMVLMTVLWVVLIVSLISFSLAASVRVQATSTQASFDSERALLMAKGAVQTVFYGMSKKQDITNSSHAPITQKDGEYLFPFETGEARVRLENSAGRIDLNGASDKLLASMFDSLGVDQQTRNKLVDCILDWRDADDIPHLYGAEVDSYPGFGVSDRKQSFPRNAGFQSVDELLSVLNMTRDLFYGSFQYETATGRYRRIPGVRDLVTISSGTSNVDANEASLEVFRALPEMKPELAEQIIEERKLKPFADANDLVKRIPQMESHEALQYLIYSGTPSTTLISKATIFSSGATRTVRLTFTRDQRVLILMLVPQVVTRKIDDVLLGRWQFQ